MRLQAGCVFGAPVLDSSARRRGGRGAEKAADGELFDGLDGKGRCRELNIQGPKVMLSEEEDRKAVCARICDVDDLQADRNFIRVLHHMLREYNITNLIFQNLRGKS